jgi:hypothetical protein
MDREWTSAMTDAVVGRIGALMMGGDDAEEFVADGMAVTGLSRDAYAQWFHDQMRSETDVEEFEDHLRRVLAAGIERVERRA